MKTKIQEISIGVTLGHIFDSCEKRCDRYCCGLLAYEFLPIWMVPIFESSDVTQISKETQKSIENELNELEHLINSREETDSYNLQGYGNRCSPEELNFAIGEIRDALIILAEKDSFRKLTAGRYYKP